MTGPWIAAFVVLSALVLALAVIVLGLLRRFSEALERVEQAAGHGGAHELGLRPGQQMTPVQVHTADGHEVALPVPDAPRTVVVLLEPDCAPCGTVMGQLLESGWPPSAPPLYVVLPDHPDSRVFAAGHSPGVGVGYQRDRLVSSAFGTNVSPVAYVVDGSGRVLAADVPAGVASLVELATVAPTNDLAFADRSN